jgi:MFS family permease
MNMNDIQAFFKRYDAAIWVRFTGTLVTKVAQSMMYPFLVLYLSNQMNGSVLEATAVVGLESAAGFLINFYFGGISDRFGRKPIMMLSLLIQGLALTGFVFAETLCQFAILITMLGAGAYMFFPAADAQVADLVPQEQRAEVYAFLNTAVSIGLTLGPVIGLVVFTKTPAIGFGFFAVMSFLYLFLVWWKIRETLPEQAVPVVGTAPSESAMQPKFNLRGHMPLVWFTLLAVPISTLTAQTWSTLPLHLKEHFATYNTMVTVTMTIGSIFSVLLQLWLGKKTEHFQPQNVIFVSYLLYATGAVGLGFAPNLAVLVLFYMVLCLGSMLVQTHFNKMISVWAPVDMRGRYFSLFGLHWRISEMFGPFAGGLMLKFWNGQAMFSVFAGLLVFGALAQRRSIRQIQAKHVPASVATSEAVAQATVTP